MKKLLQRFRKSEKGFTLIELIVVIAILGILAAILIPTVTNIISTAQTNTNNSNAKTAYMAAQVLQAQYATSAPATKPTQTTFISDVETKANIKSPASVSLTYNTTDGSFTDFVYYPDTTTSGITEPDQTLVAAKGK